MKHFQIRSNLLGSQIITFVITWIFMVFNNSILQDYLKTTISEVMHKVAFIALKKSYLTINNVPCTKKCDLTKMMWEIRITHLDKLFSH